MRSVPLHVGRVELGVGSRWKIADRAVRADDVVVVLPFGKDFAGMVEGREHVSFRSSSHSRPLKLNTSPST